MNNVIRIVFRSIGIGMTAAMLIAAVVWGFRSRPLTDKCQAVHFWLLDAGGREYVSTSELTALLQSENCYPVGYAVNRVSLQRIEDVVRHHPMVRTAECYLTPRQEIEVEIYLRRPLLRVQNGTEQYFIDTDRRVMPVRSTVQDTVLVVTGSVGTQLASTELADFAQWLQSNKYWRTRVHHLQVRNNRNILLYLNGDQPRVMMGNMSGYEGKLYKLRTFLAHQAQNNSDTHYTEIDLRFRGQVVARR